MNDTMSASQLAFLQSLRKGDLIRVGKTLRVIREVSWRTKNGHLPKGTFNFVKLRCSWTTRPYTTYTTSDMQHWSIELVARNWKEKDGGWLQRKLDEEHKVNRAREVMDCDIVGVAY